MGPLKGRTFRGPMKNYLSAADLAIWVILIASKLVLCFCILKKRFTKRLLWFSTLIFVSTINSLLLFAIAFSASYATYYHAFYVGEYIESALVFLTLIECGRWVLPGLDLPKKEKAIAFLLGALAAVCIFAALWPQHSLGSEKRIEVAACFAVAVVFVFIAVYSRYLGLHGSRLLAGISYSLGLLYLLQGITAAITGHYPFAIVRLVSQLNSIANVLAVIAWIVVILSPWGEYTMTEADLRKIEEAFAQVEASLDKLDVKIV